MADKEVLKKIIEDYVSNSVQPSETQIECDSLRIANARLADELNLKIDLYNKLYIAFQRVLADATEEGRALRAENARLRSALEWYADKAHWKGGIAGEWTEVYYPNGEHGPSVVKDNGTRARAALSDVPGQ